MARLDVYVVSGKVGPGYVLDVQARLLDHLSTRAVIPLLPRSLSPPPIRGLNPVVQVDGESLTLMTQLIAAVPVDELKRPVLSLDSYHDEVTRALDLLLIGF